MAQHGPNVEPTCAQQRPNLAQHGPNIGEPPLRTNAKTLKQEKRARKAADKSKNARNKNNRHSTRAREFKDLTALFQGTHYILNNMKNSSL